MSYQVAILNFEGPLDLLLQLVERSQLAVTSISLAEVTEQYLAYINQLSDLNPTELQQFITLASRLIYIKSLALLPNSNIAEDSETQELAAELAEYARFREAARQLRDHLLQSSAVSFKSARRRIPVSTKPVSVSTQQLQQAMSEALGKLPPASATINAPSYSLSELADRCLAYVDTHHPALFQSFLAACQDRLELVVAFLAILELIKSGSLSVSQENQFGDMIMIDEHTRSPATP